MGRNDQNNLAPPQTEMVRSRVRPFTPDDVPRVIDLLYALFPRTASDSFELKKTLLEEMSFHDPMRGSQSPPLVYEEPDGRISGFLGVSCRQMEFQGEEVEVAISQNFMVSPERRGSLVGVKLLKAFFNEGQDLSIADAATKVSREIWTTMGGEVAPAYSLHWKRPLKPFRWILHYARKHSRIDAPFVMLKPIAWLGDSLAGSVSRSPFRFHKPELPLVHLSLSELVEAIESLSRSWSLRPVYTLESLEWLLTLVSRPPRFGNLVIRGIEDEDGELGGWFIYYRNPGGVSEVLQLTTRETLRETILQHLFYDANKHGILESSGRVEPQFMQNLSGNKCYIQAGRMWMLVHSEYDEITSAIQRGDSFISRLEGDLWLL